MNERSLSFQALDAHVIAGRADEIAMMSEEVTYTFAQLLHESAALAAGLRDLGVGVSTPVRLSADDRLTRVLGALAIVRLGAEPVKSGWYLRIGGTPPVVETGGETIDLDLVRRTGRLDPATALAHDRDGYAERMTNLYGDVVAILVRGGTLT